jgi:phosphotransferase system HPr (HPr) family protein
MDSPVRKTVLVTLENGLHLVPCSLIAQVARRHEGEVRIHNGKLSVDAKNVLDLMSLQAECGTSLDLEATGSAAQDVIRALVELFDSKFGNAESPKV